VSRKERDKKSIFIGCVVRAVQQRWLECDTASVLRTQLAGLSKFATAVDSGKENSVASFASPRKAVTNLNRPANSVRSDNLCPDSSKGIWAAREP
jgi:hypothetical protein